MGTGGGGGGKKGGSGGKKPPEDKIEIESYPNEDEEDNSSLETSLELDVNPQQLASVGLDRPLLRLRLTPRRRVTAAAPDGSGMPPPLGGGTETVPLWEKQNGIGFNKPVKGGGGPPQPPDGGVGELAHCSWKGVEGHLSDQWVEEELLHLVVMKVVMGMMMIMEGVIDHLPQGEMEEMAVMVVMMEMAVEEMIHHHHQIKGNHNTAEIRETDGYMWYRERNLLEKRRNTQTLRKGGHYSREITTETMLQSENMEPTKLNCEILSEKVFITSPADIDTHRKVKLQDAEVLDKYKKEV